MRPPTRPTRAGSLILAAALLLGLGRVLFAAWEQGWTYDEPYHLGWSERLLDQGVSERESSPLWNSKTPISVPYVLAGRAAKAMGVAEGRPLMFATRLPGVLAYLLLVATTFTLAQRWFGSPAAVVAAAALALEPSVVANAPLATADVPYALAAMLALLAALRWADRPGWAAALGLGLALGLAFVAKFSAFTLLPVLAILPWLLPRERRPAAGRLLVQFGLVTAACLFAIAAAYFFTDVGVPLQRLPFHADAFERFAAGHPNLRAPLPAAFITGVDRTFNHERTRDWAVTILGGIYPQGAPHYFLASWAVKTPLALLALQLLGLYGLWRLRLWRGPAFGLLAWAFVFQWIYFSFFMRAQIGYRFALMLLPVCLVLAAAGFVAAWERPLAAALLVALAGAETLPYLGNDLAFTNAFVQPKKEAFKYIAGSSLDYGQNEDKLEAWLESRDWPKPLLEPSHVRPGINVIGVNVLAGVANDRAHRWLREHVEPKGHFRHSYLWFDIDAATYDRLLEEDRHLVSRPEDVAACPARDGGHPVDVATWKRFPRLEGTQAWRVCFEAEARADVGLIDKGGGLSLGRLGWKPRDWDRLRDNQQAWYRLDPGVHSLVALPLGFRGRWRVIGGPVRIWMLPAPYPFSRAR